MADAVVHLRATGEVVPDEWLTHTSPVGWEHVGLSGDFLWDRAAALSPDAPFIIHELWRFAKSAYLDPPIPTLFKERLFVYLSRFCEVRYCITRHTGFC